MIEETDACAAASSCPTWSAGSKLSTVMLSSRMIGLAVHHVPRHRLWVRVMPGLPPPHCRPSKGHRLPPRLSVLSASESHRLSTRLVQWLTAPSLQVKYRKSRLSTC